MHVDDIHDLLGDRTRSRRERLLRLQGWRGAELRDALAAGWAMRLGPAVCAVLGVVGLAVHGTGLYLVSAALSAAGVLTRNHPIELVWVWWTRRRGKTVPPMNRCGRRFACSLGAIFFAIAAVGVALDLPAVVVGAGVTMVVVPAFVAITNLCVPSLVLTAVLGADAVACRRYDGRPLRGFVARPARRGGQQT